MTATEAYGRFVAARSDGDGPGMLSALSDGLDSDDADGFLGLLFDADADIRPLTASRADAGLYEVRTGDGTVVGEILNRVFTLSFRSFESPMGRDFPYVRSVDKVVLDVDPGDDRVIGAFELFDRDVRSGRSLGDVWSMRDYIGASGFLLGLGDRPEGDL